MMKRFQMIVLVCVLIALVQMACSMPLNRGTNAATATPGLPTFTPVVVTATPGSIAQAATATSAPSITAAAPTAAPTATTAASGSCSFLATFVADVTIPDDTRMAANAAFTKTWRVRNDGTCTWGPGKALNALVFTGGSALGAPGQIALAGSVAPGQTVDLSVNMSAPAAAGVYTSEWMFRVDGVNGVSPYTGLGPDGSFPLYARIVVGAAPVKPADPSGSTRIQFAAGATNATVEGSVKAWATKSYVLTAGKGQLLMASFASAAADVHMQIVDAATGKVLIAAGGSSTQTLLPSTGDYLIQLIAGGADANFTLGVIIPSRISFSAGATSASVDGVISGRQPVMYLLRALKGQTMTVRVTSPSNGVALTIYGIDDGQPLVRADFGRDEWSGELNLTQDYMIQVMPSVESTTFSMTVTVK